MNGKLSVHRLIQLLLWLLFSLYLFSLLLPIVERYLISLNTEPRIVTPRGELAASEKSTIELFNQASPSVVFISTHKIVRSFWTRDIRKVPKGTGSGFIWDAFGHVVTNYHVIEGAAEATIRLNDGRSYQASLVGASPNHDLAVLKIDVAIDMPPAVPIGTSDDLQVGQSVFAIGNPFGLDYTLTSGIVSALNRSLSGDANLIINNLIQTDAAINPGNSGGPLLDSAGRLIGINTAIYSPSGAYAGIGFAVPVDTVNRVVPQLIATGSYKRPSLGIAVDQDINDQLTEQLGINGVVVLALEQTRFGTSNSFKPAQVSAYGIVLGDVIQAINKQKVTDVKSLFTQLDNYQIGDTVAVSVLRDGELITVTAKLQ